LVIQALQKFLVASYDSARKKSPDDAFTPALSFN
jgi:hypothetical protein